MMGKNNKTITKCCPFCELQVAVACKTCPGCKHSFYSAKRLTLSQTTSLEDTTPGGRRRTERVKREKPNYYDASEFEKKTKKRRLERNSESGRERGRPSTQGLKKRRKKKLGKSKDQEDEDPCVAISTDKVRQCSIILAELNRKFFTTTWKVG